MFFFVPHASVKTAFECAGQQDDEEDICFWMEETAVENCIFNKSITNQPTIQSPNQPTNQSPNQPVTQPTSHQPTNQPTNQPTSHPTNKPTSHPTN